MNDLALRLVMLCSFALAVYGAHALCSASGGGVMRRASMRSVTLREFETQNPHRAIGGTSRASRSKPQCLRRPAASHSDTKRD